MAEKEKIERLKSIRAGHRGVVTRHINEAKTILEHRREPEKQKTLSKIDQEVLEIFKLTEIKREIQESENIVSKILETKQQTRKYKKKSR